MNASVGDALIFMTKAAGAVLALVILLGSLAAGAIWWDQSSYAEQLRTEKELSREALEQVDILTGQINALRVQVAALEQMIYLEEQNVEDQQATIADLGNRLNACLVEGSAQ
jgi:chemotaxis protein MotB